MIDFNKAKLKEVLKFERTIYYSSKLNYWLHLIMNAELARIFQFQKFLRKAEFYKFKNKKIRYALALRKKNKIGNKLGFSIHCGSFDIGLKICHVGSVIVNGDARIGKNCVLHGNNCIGNSNDNNESVPTIGDNFSVGFGSVVYGKINICDDVKIGAMSLVNKNIENSGTYVGVPLKIK